MVKQAGLPLSAEQKATLYDADWMLEEMIATVNTPMSMEIEPAHMFTPGGALMDPVFTIAEASKLIAASNCRRSS